MNLNYENISETAGLHLNSGNIWYKIQDSTDN